MVQYLFYEQWAALKAYANAKGVEFIGDIPIYVSPDSSDLWADPSLFQVDAGRRADGGGGLPAGRFRGGRAALGQPAVQLGCTLKDRVRLVDTTAAPCKRRVRCGPYRPLRGFESYYAIPARDKTAVNGVWRKGPGTAFIDVIRRKLPDVTSLPRIWAI